MKLSKTLGIFSLIFVVHLFGLSYAGIDTNGDGIVND
jgi:hypothetical protein